MIKHLVALILGLLIGLLLLAAALYYNPFSVENRLSPLSVTDNFVIKLNYSAVAADGLVYTNDGESQVDPHPAKVLQLWEPTIRQTSTMATTLTDSRGQLAGVGIKFSSRSEETSILDGQALVDSVWHIYMPGRGSVFVAQTENYWEYIREIVVPARWSSANNWRGTWRGNITSGPLALGTGRAVGGSGELDGIETEAVEALTAKAYSVEQGPVAMQGELSIEIPGAAVGDPVAAE